MAWQLLWMCHPYLGVGLYSKRRRSFHTLGQKTINNYGFLFWRVANRFSNFVIVICNQSGICNHLIIWYYHSTISLPLQIIWTTFSNLIKILYYSIIWDKFGIGLSDDRSKFFFDTVYGAKSAKRNATFQKRKIHNFFIVFCPRVWNDYLLLLYEPTPK